MQLPLLSDASLNGKRVLLRAGFDVPIENGAVVDTSRIETMVPTMKHLLDAGAALIVMAHQGRPKGERVPEMSQEPIVPVLKELLDAEVSFSSTCIGDEPTQKAKALKSGEVLLLENLRYHPEERANDAAFAKALASLADVYVNDAFTNCHRKHASMVGVPKHLPSYCGLHLQAEIEHLSLALESPKQPITLIISGVKMETKVPVIRRFLDIGDDILIGGGIANTFLMAAGYDVGASKVDEEFVDDAREILEIAKNEENANLHLPLHVVCANSPDADQKDCGLDELDGDAIFDLGVQSLDDYVEAIQKSSTIIWNGPIGFYEKEQFSAGTHTIADAVVGATEKGSISILGGGDTIDFHTRYDRDLSAYSHVSMGGGAMLEFLSGKELPALAALQEISIKV